MTLIDDTNLPLRKAQAVARTNELWEAGRREIKILFERLMRNTWDNEFGFTPDEMLSDVVGVPAMLRQFRAAQSLKMVVNAFAPDTITIEAPADLIVDNPQNPTTLAFRYTLTVQAVAGASVTVNNVTSVAGDDGLATFAGLAGGTYAVTAEAEGYEAIAPINVTLVKSGSVKLVCVPLSSLTVVTVPGAEVTVGQTTRTAGDDGLALFPGLTRGDYDVSATAEGYTIEPTTARVDGDVRFALTATADEPAQEAQPE